MPFSHHSHSGQFCGHAKDTLEQVILTAISKNIRIFSLTEHMPRSFPEDLYAEEIAASITPTALHELFAEYHVTALQLREKYKSQITLLIGFEIDYIRPTMRDEIYELQKKYVFDLMVGSVHHVEGVPIDFSKELFLKAVEECEKPTPSIFGFEKNGATKGEERLFEVYFDTQFDMLTHLKPPVVGHFDLIRLLCDDYRVDFKKMAGVWERVVRNVKFIKSYGGLVEINSAAVRKGWEWPYPGPDVMSVVVEEGVGVVMSDDSHGIAQVAYGYGRVVEYLAEVGVQELVYLDWEGEEGVRRGLKDGVVVIEGEIEVPEVGKVVRRTVRLEEVKAVVGA